MITAAVLSRVAPRLTAARCAALAPILQNAAVEAGVKGLNAEAMWLAQLALESWRFTRMEEDLRYSAAALRRTWPSHFTWLQAVAYQFQPARIANRAYANRYGNGPESGGDGYKYRGRGFVQLTWKANYANHGKLLGLELVSNPDLARQDGPAARIAAAFWRERNCEFFAEKGDVAGVTRRINGGLTDLGDRQALYAVARAALVAGK